MTLQVPTTEPTAARAGDTWRWERDLPDYPAPTWTLTYTLCNASAAYTLTAGANGVRHRLNLASDDTADYVAGAYDWIAHVSDGTDRFQIGAGRIQIHPDLTEAERYDGRSHARKVLEALQALIEQRAVSGDLDLVQAAVGDKNIARDRDALWKARDRYAALVAQEDAAAALARGERPAGPTPGFIQMRF